MFQSNGAFSGFAVDDVDAAMTFYRDTLGMAVTPIDIGFALGLASGGSVLVYGKPNHRPADFTVLNFPVDDVDAAVDDLRSRGIDTKIYPDDAIPTDERGVMRGRGPDIAWFRDPSGNVLSVFAD